eukprot:Sspe_Gene.71426::Locus_42351_Transcript_1_1_Confidence_1.000_Length_776::g.71426::m.71426
MVWLLLVLLLDGCHAGLVSMYSMETTALADEQGLNAVSCSGQLQTAPAQCGNGVVFASAVRCSNPSPKQVPLRDDVWAIGLWVKVLQSGLRAFLHLGNEGTCTSGLPCGIYMGGTAQGLLFYDYHHGSFPSSQGMVKGKWFHASLEYNAAELVLRYNGVDVLRRAVQLDMVVNVRYGGLVIGSTHSGGDTRVAAGEYVFDNAKIYTGYVPMFHEIAACGSTYHTPTLTPLTPTASLTPSPTTSATL